MSRREARVESDGGIVCERCIVADSFGRRLRGLLGRRSLAPDQGLLLIGSPSIQTTFMRFPIDALFLDRELAVIGIAHRLKPWRVAGRRRAKHILELRAGEAARRGVAVGTHLRLIEPATAPVAPARRPEDADAPIRVLLGASDRRFLRVASFLLGRKGFAVSKANRLGDLLDAVARGKADVVVLDATGPGRWSRAATALEDWNMGVGVLLVSDEPAPGSTSNALPKWGSFDRLVHEIRHMHRRNVTALPV